MRESDWTAANQDSLLQVEREGVMSMWRMGVAALVLTVCHFSAVMFIHASLRLRNLKNKLENKMEGIGLKRTPMGIVLDALEQQEDNINKFTEYISKVKE